MMLVKTGAPDVVPRSRLVAGVALVDLRVGLVGDSPGNHLEVFHIVTRRSLMALGAIGRARRRMLKCRNRPLGCRVARSAVLPQKSEMFVFCAVARSAVEFGFERCNERMIFRQNLVVRLSWNVRAVGHHVDADLRQCFVIHHTQICVNALMLDVAGGAI